MSSPYVHAHMKKRVMRRVYTIWFVRQIAPALFLQLPLFAALAAYVIAREFFVANIMHSTRVALYSDTNSATALWDLFVAGIRNTSAVPLVIILLSTAITAVLAVRVATNLRAISGGKARYQIHEHAL